MRPHGHITRYTHGPDQTGQAGKGCRCAPCRAACARVGRRRRLAIATGRHQPDAMPAGLARNHLRRLHDAGHALTALTRQARGAVSYHTVQQVYKGHRPVISRRVHDAILSIRADVTTDSPFASTLGAQRRAQALAYLGWSFAEQARRIGISTDVYENAVTRKYPTWRAESARAQEALYDRLAWAPPPTGWLADRCRKRARINGWASPPMWEDDQGDWLDDPDRGPTGARQYGRSGIRASTHIDEIAVAAVVAGDEPWTILHGDEERRAVLARMLAAKIPGETIRHRLRISGSTYSRLTAPPPAQTPPVDTPEREAA